MVDLYKHFIDLIRKFDKKQLLFSIAGKSWSQLNKRASSEVPHLNKFLQKQKAILPRVAFLAAAYNNAYYFLLRSFVIAKHLKFEEIEQLHFTKQLKANLMYLFSYFSVS